MDSEKSAQKDMINVAILGAGEQGQHLMGLLLEAKGGGVRFVAICDIWKNGNRQKAYDKIKLYNKKHGYQINLYDNYKEMLEAEDHLDAVIVATPDFCHAEHSCACLKKGLHVYCEATMSHTIEGAREMVKAQKSSGKLLQIGHQRRSNPRYLHCYEKLIVEASILGRITTVNGQWNRSKSSCAPKTDWQDNQIDEKTLNQYGYDNMHQFRNWRLSKNLGAGFVVEAAAQQADVYSWFLGCNPNSIIASGGVDYWKEFDHYDNAMVVYEYQTKAGKVQACCRIGMTNSFDGYHECFMGDEGNITCLESAKSWKIYRESWVNIDKWRKWVNKGYITVPRIETIPKEDQFEVLVDVIPTIEYIIDDIPVEMTTPEHLPHLRNFFNAIRGTEKLNCPAQVGYETTVIALKINEAIVKARRLEFKPEDFRV